MIADSLVSGKFPNVVRGTAESGAQRAWMKHLQEAGVTGTGYS